ncbi:MAG: metallophosphoesterase [Chloroflexi bacterium]|nr:metallophosphoesterase [Chloroflexota bacterium]
MKFVLFSDLHLDRPFAWLGHDAMAARRRRQALRDTLRRIVDLTQEVEADALLCGGDLYEHERFTPDTAAFVQRAFADVAPTPVFVAPGNHDWLGPSSLYRQTRWSQNVHLFGDTRLTPVTLLDGLTLWGAGHQVPANTPGFLDDFQVDRGGVHLALFHGSERGWLGRQQEGTRPHAPFDTAQIRRAGLHHAFLGHFHTPRAADDHTYPGNPEPLDFGEAGQRGAVIATIAPDGTVRREWRRVSQTVTHDLSLDVSGCASLQDIHDDLEGLLSGKTGIARVTLAGELDPDVDLRLTDLDRMTHNLEGLVVRVGDVYDALDLDVVAAEPTVRGQFVRDVRAADLPDQERRRILLTGLRALAGRTDLGVL